MPDKTITLLLAGGVGSRLHPLTSERAKPAVPFGGKYHIIDFSLSNCLHSGLRRVLVLTQYKSLSLQKHLRDGWSIFNPSLGEYITPVPAQMRVGSSWYAGTADAVYQNLYLLKRSGAPLTLILPGDHIYRMDYQAMIKMHREQKADISIACLRVPKVEASRFGTLSVDHDQRILDFQEKPENPATLPDDSTQSLVSMGIYIFSTELLCEIVRNDHANSASSHDFGMDILPGLVHNYKVSAYQFGGERGRVSNDQYWRDVGTIDAYFDANMDLLKPQPLLDMYQAEWPIRTCEIQAPPARTVSLDNKNSLIVNSILNSGSIVNSAHINHSILSANVRVEPDAQIENSIIFDNVVIEQGAKLQNCIVDKNCRVPTGIRIGYDHQVDKKHFKISKNGITVVPEHWCGYSAK